MKKQHISLQEEVSSTILPGEDFYMYVNQKWLAANPVPANKSRTGTLADLSDDNIKRLKRVCASADTGTEPSNVARVKAFYRAAMDEATMEQAGLGSLQPVLDAIDTLHSHDALADFITSWHARGLGLVWRPTLDIDDKDSRRYVMRLEQSGLGLPDRDFYFEDGERFETVRTQYLVFLTAVFTLLNKSDAAERAARVYELETKLAKASSTAVERRDVPAKYNSYTRMQLQQEFPSVDWASYLKTIGCEGPKELLISQPSFMRTALALLANESIDTWRSYLLAHCIRPLLPALPKVYDDVHFQFYGRVMGGARKKESRYHRTIQLCMRMLPEPTGQLFVEAYFDETAKVAIYDLVGHIQAALRRRIMKLDWMSEGTKLRALRKLDTFLPLLGYPDTWKDYSELEISRVHIENVLALCAFQWRYDMQRLMRPVDRKEWLMSPALVNAYYWGNTNGITFPAGILQSPLFDACGDFAANYGGIGVVIGHEIIHGFDDKGSMFDEYGNLHSWWTDEDRAQFDARAKQLSDQYDQYEIEGRHVNGTLTLGENIADLGGTLIAYDALAAKLAESGERQPVDGRTPEQRFFLSLARTWRGNTRPELALQMLLSDPHSPNMLRVNAVVSNIDAFYRAFAVRPGSVYYKAPDARIRIW